MENNAPFVKPEVVFIEELLGNLSQGILRVPRFQRPFVWGPERMRTLFDSIYNGYPIGSLLFWETNAKMKSLDLVGPVEIPESKSSPKTYILDGHQRLATLFGALMLLKFGMADDEKIDWKWKIWFDLENKEFIHLTKDNPSFQQFPVWALLRTVDFIEQSRKIGESCPSAQDAAKLITLAEGVAQKIKNYKVAVTTIRGGSLEQAVGIFSRINKLGVSITPDQMVSALTYSDDSDKLHLADRIDQIVSKLDDYRFGNTNRMTIFHAIVASAGKKIHKSDWENLAERIKPELSEAAEDAEKALGFAASFLNHIGVPDEKLLPYSAIVLLLSEFFKNYFGKLDDLKGWRWDKFDPDLTAILNKWFWCVSLSGWFAGQNTTQINNGLDDMRRLAKGEISSFDYMPLNDKARPFPSRFDLRSARVRSLILYMLSLKPLEPRGQKPVDIIKILYGSGKQMIPYIYPQIEGPLKSSPANRILLNIFPGKPVRDQISSIQDLGAEAKKTVLESHGISEEAFEAFLQGDKEKFVEIRKWNLVRWEKKFIESLGIPTSEEVGEPEIDVGDTDMNGLA